ncbi:siderophore ABC transporter substrate-binding protein [Pseudooceanicola sp. 502str34]
MRSLLGAVLLACSATTLSAQDVTVQTARGDVTLDGLPETVVTMDLAVLDLIDAIGGEVAGVPTMVLPEYLSKYDADSYTKLGSPFEPNVEQVAALQPDLIIVAGRSAQAYDELARIAPIIDLTAETTDMLASIKRNAATLGMLYGAEEAAEDKVAELETALAEVKAKAAEAGPALTLLTTGGRMSTHGDAGRFGILYNEMGFTPAIEEVKAGNHGQPISFEFIREVNPNWIFVVDRDAAIGRDGQPAAQMLDNAMVNGTAAAEAGHIVYLEPSHWYLVGAGVTAMIDSAKAISQALDN